MKIGMYVVVYLILRCSRRLAYHNAHMGGTYGYLCIKFLLLKSHSLKITEGSVKNGWSRIQSMQIIVNDLLSSRYGFTSTAS